MKLMYSGTMPVAIGGATHMVVAERYRNSINLIVDGIPQNSFPVTAANNFFALEMDIPVYVAGCNMIVAARGKNFRLAADGRYIDNGEVFAPARPLPGWAWVFVALTFLIPILSMGGIVNFAIGIGGGMLCALVARSKMQSTALKVLSCVGITVATYVVWFLFLYAVTR